MQTLAEVLLAATAWIVLESVLCVITLHVASAYASWLQLVVTHFQIYLASQILFVPIVSVSQYLRLSAFAQRSTTLSHAWFGRVVLFICVINFAKSFARLPLPPSYLLPFRLVLDVALSVSFFCSHSCVQPLRPFMSSAGRFSPGDQNCSRKGIVCFPYVFLLFFFCAKKKLWRTNFLWTIAVRFFFDIIGIYFLIFFLFNSDFISEQIWLISKMMIAMRPSIRNLRERNGLWVPDRLIRRAPSRVPIGFLKVHYLCALLNFFGLFELIVVF